MRSAGTVLITGGAGFVGTNLADRLARDGRRVILFDDLSRPGVADNLRWLAETHGTAIDPVVGDVRDAAALRPAVERADAIVHLAAQVAVTTSLADPRRDVEVNLLGTFNLLEAARAAGRARSLVFTSTNKVYGLMDDLAVVDAGRRYAATGDATRGIGESRPLDFHSPYGCSKGAADQYVLDYARSYGLPTAVFRMSCIYGPHQHGTEDQGWVAHFALRAAAGEPITIYGDGKQVRDVLFVEDLVEAFGLAERHMPALAGQVFNIGGGPERAVSLLEVIELLGHVYGRRPRLAFGPWRTGDQRFYVSDTSKFAGLTGWRASTPIERGVTRLCAWLAAAGRSGAPVALHRAAS